MRGKKRPAQQGEFDDEGSDFQERGQIRRASQSLSGRPQRSVPKPNYSTPSFRDYVEGIPPKNIGRQASPDLGSATDDETYNITEIMNNQQNSTPVPRRKSTLSSSSYAENKNHGRGSDGEIGSENNVTAPHENTATEPKRVLNISETIEMHRAILPVILLSGGGMVEISVFSGVDEEEEQLFMIHKGLLSLHSSWFRRQFASKSNVVHLDDTSPAMFAKFAVWLYQGMIHHTLFSSELETNIIENDWEGLWVLGMKLGAPNFQNYAMIELLRTSKKESNLKWPNIEHVQFVLNKTERHSILYRAVVDGVACKNPLEADNADEVSEWISLLEKNTGLHMDITKAMARCARWGKKPHPGDDKQKNNYFVDAVPLDQLWKTKILEAKDEGLIRYSASKGCLRGLLEVAHLDNCGP